MKKVLKFKKGHNNNPVTELSLKKIDNVTIYTLLIFLVLNTLKLTLFNNSILPEKTVEAFLYKAVLALPANVLLFSLLLKFRSRLPFLLFYLIESVYIFSYMSYYAYFGNYLHLFQAAALFTEGVGPIKHFTIPVNTAMLILLLDLPVFIKLILKYNEAELLTKASRKPVIAAMRIISLALILLLEIWNFANGVSILQMSKSFFKAETRIIEKYGTFINNIVDITVNYGGENMINHFKYGETVSAVAKNKDSSNIVVIQVEALDANIISQKHRGNYITPYLHSISQKGIYYPYVLSYHKSGGTSDCEFSILNSIEPLGNYPSIKIPKYDYPNSVVKSLKKDGYVSMAFHGNIGNYYNRDVAFAKMGFDSFDDIRRMNIDEQGWGVPDHEVFAYVLDKMEMQNEPFFSYIITMSSHMPFENTVDYYSNNSYDDIEDEIVKNYYTVMSYVDQSIQDFVQKVKDRFPDTSILIYGDHTPGIESDEYKQASFMVSGDYFEFVPFIMLTPDNKSYQESRYAASFLDISPTILYAAGIDFSFKTDGVNLADAPDTLPMIPFKEKLYRRDELYSRIEQVTG